MTRRIALVLALVLGLVVGAHADPSSEQSDQIQGILKLVESGVSDDVIVKQIAASKFVYDLTTDDILELRDRGLSDRVLEAMLDTAVEHESSSQQEQTPQNSVYTRDDSQSAPAESNPDVYLNLSAGYYSPWYQYPYAWGYYYDPFPAYYSLFYYPPFFFSAGWGWYGSCHYYYPAHWGYNGWHDPYYWHSVGRHSWYVSVPRHPVNRWAAGRGLPHGGPAPVPRTGQVASRPGNSMSTPRLSHAWDRDRIYARRSHAGQSLNSRHGSIGVLAPDPGRRQALPNNAPRGNLTRYLRSYPFGSSPSVSPPRGAIPATPAPHYSAPSPQPRSFASPPRSAAPASAPRSGMGTSAPRHR